MGAKQRIYTAGVLYYTVLEIRTDFQKGRQEDVMERLGLDRSGMCRNRPDTDFTACDAFYSKLIIQMNEYI